MIIFIDLTKNKIEIEGCKEPDLDVKNTLIKIGENIENYDVDILTQKVSIKEINEFLDKIFKNKLVFKMIDGDIKPTEPKNK